MLFGRSFYVAIPIEGNKKHVAAGISRCLLRSVGQASYSVSCLSSHIGGLTDDSTFRQAIIYWYIPPIEVTSAATAATFKNLQDLQRPSKPSKTFRRERRIFAGICIGLLKYTYVQTMGTYVGLI